MRSRRPFSRLKKQWKLESSRRQSTSVRLLSTLSFLNSRLATSAHRCVRLRWRPTIIQTTLKVYPSNEGRWSCRRPNQAACKRVHPCCRRHLQLWWREQALGIVLCGSSTEQEPFQHRPDSSPRHYQQWHNCAHISQRIRLLVSDPSYPRRKDLG